MRKIRHVDQIARGLAIIQKTKGTSTQGIQHSDQEGRIRARNIRGTKNHTRQTGPTSSLDHTVLLEFEPTIGTFGGSSLGILVSTIRGRRIAIHKHTAQVDEALDFIFPTRCQEVLKSL
jgi:hypothetical protein